MNVLVTGGAGFIGSNFINHIINNTFYDRIVCLDLLTYAGNSQNLIDVYENEKFVFAKGDIRNKELVDYLVKTHRIDIFVNFAAESHVDRSIKDPYQFISTNVLGTQVLLSVAKDNNIYKFVQISTDEVYGSLDNQGYFTENTTLAPNSPYSASKAAADLLVRSYHETYGLNINITRCSNNYGPYQFPEKLIPLMISYAIDCKALPVYGNGENIRDWLHVKDHCEAIDLVIQKGDSGEVFNIGGNNEYKNINIVRMIVKKLKVSENLIKFVEDRQGHDFRYAIDASKIITQLGWKPKYSFDKGIEETIQWYLQNQQWLLNIKSGKYRDFVINVN